MAFSIEEVNSIRETLVESATECAVKYGVRKTSVEQLAADAGISKGSFYRFYDSKELLFFEVLERIHAVVYEAARAEMMGSIGLPPAERMGNTILAMCRKLDEIGVMRFMEEDSEYVLRKIPAKVKAEHYHSDEVHIREMLEESGLEPVGGIELAAAVIRGLLLTISHKVNIGEKYPLVLELMIRGACVELFPER